MHNYLVENKIGAFVTAMSDTLASQQYSSSSDAALVTIFHRQPISVTFLAEILGLSQPAATRLVQRLSEQGLISKQEKSGRERLLTLSEEGREAAIGLNNIRLARIGETLFPLSENDRQSLDRIVSIILANLVEDRKHARHMCRHCDHGICHGQDCPVGSEVSNKEKSDNKNVSRA